MRLAFKEQHTKIDSSKKVAAVTLRKAAPVPGKYAVGDLVSFKREQGADTPEDKWSSATRIIGFDGPKVVWGLNESLPFCLEIDKIRPATPEQTLAYLYIHGHETGVDRTVISDDQQQGYIDEYHPKIRPRKDTEVPQVEADDEDLGGELGHDDEDESINQLPFVADEAAHVVLP